MNGRKFHDKAAQLIDRASGEDTLMRSFYVDLARSYSRLGWEADRFAEERKTEQAGQTRETVNADEILARLLRLTSNQSAEVAMDQIGGAEDRPDNME